MCVCVCVCRTVTWRSLLCTAPFSYIKQKKWKKNISKPKSQRNRSPSINLSVNNDCSSYSFSFVSLLFISNRRTHLKYVHSPSFVSAMASLPLNWCLNLPSSRMNRQLQPHCYNRNVPIMYNRPVLRNIQPAMGTTMYDHIVSNVWHRWRKISTPKWVKFISARRNKVPVFIWPAILLSASSMVSNSSGVPKPFLLCCHIFPFLLVCLLVEAHNKLNGKMVREKQNSIYLLDSIWQHETLYSEIEIL